jgi:hypothetical protein
MYLCEVHCLHGLLLSVCRIGACLNGTPRDDTFHPFLLVERSRDISLSTVASLQAGWPEIMVWFMAGTKLFTTVFGLSLRPSQPPVLVGSVELKWSGHEINHDSPSDTNVKNAWSYTFTPPSVCKEWSLIELSRTLLIESLAQDSGRTLVHAETFIRRDLQIPTVKEEIRRYSSQYSARLSAHPNDLIVNLIELPDDRRLWRHLPNDLSTRFLV